MSLYWVGDIVKEAVGGTSLFFIVIFIMSIFTIYIAIAINWSMAYKVKDEILFYIEKNNGMNQKTVDDINSYTSNVGYDSRGECPSGGKKDNGCWIAASLGTIKGVSVSRHATNYCVRKLYYADSEGMPKRAYYSVRVFFQINAPIVSRLKLAIDGDTKALTNPVDSDVFGFPDATKCGVR